MDKRKWLYRKSEGYRISGSLSDKSTEAQPLPSASDSPAISSMNDAHSFETGRVDDNLIFVISGGTTRERNYFRAINKEKQITKLKIVFASKEGQGLQPKQISAKLRSFRNKKQFEDIKGVKYSLEDNDLIYLLQDVDEFEDEIRESKEELTGMNANWMISNPCFEIWLFYHHFASPMPLLSEGAGMPVSQRSKWLKQKLNEIIRGGFQTTKEIFFIDTAIKNSKKKFKQLNGIPSLYSTNVFVLAEKIKELAEGQIYEVFKQKEEIARKFIEDRINRE